MLKRFEVKIFQSEKVSDVHCNTILDINVQRSAYET